MPGEPETSQVTEQPLCQLCHNCAKTMAQKTFPFILTLNRRPCVCLSLAESNCGPSPNL